MLGWEVGNNSNDDSVKFIKTNYPLINIVKNKGNFGYAKGYNIGLENIKFEYYILINSDVEVTDNWINPIIELMDKNTDVSACQPKILNYNDKRYFESFNQNSMGPKVAVLLVCGLGILKIGFSMQVGIE